MFEATYPKAGTRGNRGEMWDALDRRKATKAVTVANEDGGTADMFGAAGVAAE